MRVPRWPAIVLPKPRKELSRSADLDCEIHVLGDYGCIAQGCNQFPSVMTLCPDCGSRFACNDFYHRDLLRQIERKRKHMQRVCVTTRLNGYKDGWPYRIPAGVTK